VESQLTKNAFFFQSISHEKLKRLYSIGCKGNKVQKSEILLLIFIKVSHYYNLIQFQICSYFIPMRITIISPCYPIEFCTHALLLKKTRIKVSICKFNVMFETSTPKRQRELIDPISRLDIFSKSKWELISSFF
jgi:hypothetical protein